MKKTLFLLLVTGLFLAPTGLVLADDGTPHDRVIIGQNFTLEAGKSIDGDLVVIGGETTVEAGATVDGDLVVIGGSLRLDGTTTGSAVVVGGSAALGAASSVGRDLVALGGSFQRAEGAQIGGDIITNLAITAQRTPRGATMPTFNFPPPSNFRFDFGPLGGILAVFFQAIGLGALGMLLTAFLHPQLDRVAQAARSQPFAAGSFGLLTILVAPLAIVLMAITLVLIPLALATVLLLVLAWLFGVVALGQIIGERLATAMHRQWEPVVAAGLGAFALGIVLGISNQVPCVGWLGSVLIGLLALGAATMTLFGTRLPWRALSTDIPAGGGPVSSPG